MKKILKEWKRYINELNKSEAKWWGPAFEELDQNPKLAWDQAWLDQNIGSEAGQGYSRSVRYIKSHPEFVFKVAHAFQMQDGAFTNGMEKKYFNKYPDFFPRTWLSSPSGIDKSEMMPGFPSKAKTLDYVPWIVIDKVFPIETGQELNQFFPELTNEMKAQNLAEAFISNLLGRLLHWASFNITSETNMDFLFSNSIQTYIETGKKGAEKLLEAANRDPMFRRLAMLSAKVGIDAKDIGTGNVGINSKGELMILDSSLTKDFSSSPYARS